MSFVFLGIQFGFALQGGFMSRIFQTLGADKDAIPLLWIAAPLTGLLVQPIIGYMSDRTWSPRWGSSKTLLLGRCRVELNHLTLGASFSCFVDGSRFFMDFRCIH